MQDLVANTGSGVYNDSRKENDFMKQRCKRIICMVIAAILIGTSAVAVQPMDAQAATKAQTAKAKKAREKKINNMLGKKAVFIGDSVMEGVSMFSGHKSNYITKVGMNIINAQDSRYKIGKKNVVQLTKSYKPSYIYIMLGANEVGWMSTAQAYSNYKSLIQKLKKACPKAKIYIISIEPVTKKFVSGHSGYTIKKIKAYNSMLKKVAKNTKVKYLNIYNYFKDKNGYLNQKYCWAGGDGLHWNVAGTKRFISSVKAALRKQIPLTYK